MQEQNQEERPLVLKQLLTGLESLYDPLGITKFTVTKTTGAKAQAQAVWLAKQLPGWVDLLNQKSGAVVINARVKFEVKRNEFSRGGWSTYENGKLVVEMVLPGGLVLEQIEDEELRKSQAGQIKKILAQKILEEFPPIFDCENPTFAANWPVTYCMRKFHRFRYVYKELDEAKFLIELAEKLLGIDAEVVGFRASEGLSDMAYLTLAWLKDQRVVNGPESYHGKLSKIVEILKEYNLEVGWPEVLEKY